MSGPTPRFAWVVFALGALCMLAMIPLGKSLEPELGRLGLYAYQAQASGTDRLLVLLFAFGFPVGVGLCMLGALAHSERSPWRLLGWSIVVAVLAAAAIWIPGLFGRHPSPAFFGRGGIVILVLAVLVLWRWALYRARLPRSLRAGADWQGAGYLAFAAAAWNLCGFAGMPAYAVYPQRMDALGAQPFAVGQLKTVMALLIIGWLFTFIGLVRHHRSTRVNDNTFR